MKQHSSAIPSLLACCVAIFLKVPYSKHRPLYLMASEHQSHCIQALTGINYTTWSEETKALLCSKGLWRLVDGKEKRPGTAGTEQNAWDVKQDMTAGEIMLNIVPKQ